MKLIYFFRQITKFIKVHMAYVFVFQTLKLKDFSKIHQLKSLRPKNKGHTNFYDCCDLTKKVYLTYYLYYYFTEIHDNKQLNGNIRQNRITWSGMDCIQNRLEVIRWPDWGIFRLSNLDAEREVIDNMLFINRT